MQPVILDLRFEERIAYNDLDNKRSRKSRFSKNCLRIAFGGLF